VSEQRPRTARRTARRGLDQHFLRSSRLAAELVYAAGISRDDLVLEIGAGSGRLTAELARAARHVLAVEVDVRWARRLAQRFGDGSRVTVLAADALELALPAEPFRVVANLPFGQTTALLRHLLDDPRAPLVRADLVVEWGYALKRAAVWPGTMLGVTWGAWWTLRIDRRLAASCFEPAPQVDAGVLVVERRLPPLVPVAERQAYRDFVRRGFKGGLRAVASPRTVRRLARRAAPRDLDVHQWAALFETTASDRSARVSPTRTL
jgi:23S rRNA (adenine-N6)-dimethyltransferase